jgi:nitroreductase
LQAPVIVVVVMEKPRMLNQVAMQLKKKEWCLIDIGISTQHFCLQAAEEGLGTCMLGWYNEKKIKELLSIPRDRTVALVITLGYAEEGYPLRRKIRKQAEEMVSYNKYQ